MYTFSWYLHRYRLRTLRDITCTCLLKLVLKGGKISTSHNPAHLLYGRRVQGMPLYIFSFARRMCFPPLPRPVAFSHAFSAKSNRFSSLKYFNFKKPCVTKLDKKRSQLYTHSYIQFHVIDYIAFIAFLWYIWSLLMRRIQLHVLTYEWSKGTIINLCQYFPCVLNLVLALNDIHSPYSLSFCPLDRISRSFSIQRSITRHSTAGMFMMF